jgi:crotonobetainyl-CoA:carnitine CoA-transferase CaiB-like acyl-CoA transferase
MQDCDFGLRYNPPQVGEHTAEVLAELGFSEQQIGELVERGVVATEG